MNKKEIFTTNQSFENKHRSGHMVKETDKSFFCGTRAASASALRHKLDEIQYNSIALFSRKLQNGEGIRCIP